MEITYIQGNIVFSKFKDVISISESIIKSNKDMLLNNSNTYHIFKIINQSYEHIIPDILDIKTEPNKIYIKIDFVKFYAIFEITRTHDLNYMFLPEEYCVTCHKIANKVCNNCNLVKYCSLQCQMKDWPLHKEFCEYYCSNSI
jgi:hypothetical protein